VLESGPIGCHERPIEPQTLEIPSMTSSLALRPIICGALATLAAAAAPCAHAASPVENYALAISWEPAFCLTNASKPECKSETPSRQDAHAFSLHGLWPQSGSYCGATSAQKSNDEAGKWTLLPAVVLQAATEAALQVEEPGTQSDLERHEWIEHGTCSGLSQQNFFAPTLAMLNSVNASNLGSTVSANVGGHLTLAQLQAAAALDYGTYAKTDIEYLCVSSGGKSWLEEVRLHMKLPSPLPTTVQSSYMAKPLDPASSSELCKSGAAIYIKAVTN
jgi:ribonuclease T2